MESRSLPVVMGVCVALAAPSALRAEPAAEPPPDDCASVEGLADAITAYDDLRIEASLELLSEVESDGELSEQQRACLLLYRGLGHSSLGRVDEAQAAFAAALRLDRDLLLPPQTSPVVVEQFEALRAEVPETSPEPTEPTEPTEPPVEVEPGPAPAPFQRRLLMTWVFVGLTGASLVGGATSLILALVTRAQARGEVHSQAEADEMLETYRLETRLAVGFLSATAALAVATVLTYFGERPRRAGDDHAEASLRLLPTLGGLVLAGSWR